MSDPPSAPPSHVPPQVSVTAILAIITGILCMPLLPTILGLVALSRINRSGGRLTGRAMAIAGIVLGFVPFIIWVIFTLLPELLFGPNKPADLTKASNDARYQEAANRLSATNNAHNLGVGLSSFDDDWRRSSHGRWIKLWGPSTALAMLGRHGTRTL